MNAASTETLAQAAVAFERGDFGTAERICRAILAGGAGADARVLLGQVLHAAGQPDLAQAEYRAVLKADPTCSDAWRRWAGLMRGHGYTKEAVACLREGLAHNPKVAGLHVDLALVLLALGDVDEAAGLLEKAVVLEPGSIAAIGNLGMARKAQGRVDDAIACYRRALEIAPDHAALHNNLGDALKMHDMDAAIASFKTALRLHPDFPEALDNLGIAYFCKNRLEDALVHCERAVQLQPGFHRAAAHSATLLFLLGRLPEAWALHRRRFELSGIKGDPYERFPVPAWNAAPLAGKALLVWTEQGLGEEILQAGMFNDAAAAAAHLTVECTPRVLSLFRRSFPAISFIPRIKSKGASTASVTADYQAAAGDLGAVFRSDFSAFPRHTGYLKADTARAEELRAKYLAKPWGEGKRIVVGIAWASYNAALGPEKTLALMDFAPILRLPGVTFVNLQYKADPAEVAAVERALGIQILTDDTIDQLGDLDPVAAQVAAMDLVISVSNSTVHLAGALNVPVWNIVPAYNASGMWHWFHEMDTSPWYPSMRIYRRTQKDAGPLIARMADDLKNITYKSMN